MWGIQPNEFWDMTLQEYYWLADHHYVQNRSGVDKHYMPAEDWEKLREMHRAKQGG